MVITDSQPKAAVPTDWLVLRVDHADEIADAVSTLLERPELAGVLLFPGKLTELWKTFKAGYVPVKAAGGLVVDEQGRLLAIRRLGRWDLPKGKVEKGEAVETAAVREVQEECGISELERGARVARTWHTYSRKGEQHLKRTDWYQMKTSSKEVLRPQEEEDIEEVRWIARSEADMLKVDTYPSLLPVIAVWEGM